MNIWNGSGFLSRDPEEKTITTKGGENMAMARFAIACQRKGKDAGADFINCVAFGKNAETLLKYFQKGRGIEISGHIQTGSYEGKNGKVYTTDVIVDSLEFPKVRKGEESASSSQEQPSQVPPTSPANNDFMDIPDDLADSLPFR